MKKSIKYVFIIVLVLLHIAVIFYVSILYNNWHKTNELIKAIKKEDVTKVERLLEKGVDPNKTDVRPSAFWSFLETSANRPLAIACDTGNLEVVELLIEHGATAEYVEYTGWSPLRETLFYYQPDDVEIVKILLENGADSNFAEDKLPVFAAADMFPKAFDKNMTNGTIFKDGYDEATAKGITEIVDILLDDNSVNIKTKSGETLLLKAVKRENVYLVEYLMSAGCDVDIKDAKGMTALDYAIENKNDEIIKLLS